MTVGGPICEIFHEIDVINSRTQGFLVLFAGEIYWRVPCGEVLLAWFP